MSLYNQNKGENMSDFVYKVNRAQISFSAELSNGEKINLSLLETNARQLQELTKESAMSENLEITLKQLKENLRGERAQDFIDDLVENGSLDAFYTTMAENFKKKREAKRKNS